MDKSNPEKGKKNDPPRKVIKPPATKRVVTIVDPNISNKVTISDPENSKKNSIPDPKNPKTDSEPKHPILSNAVKTSDGGRKKRFLPKEPLSSSSSSSAESYFTGSDPDEVLLPTGDPKLVIASKTSLHYADGKGDPLVITVKRDSVQQEKAPNVNEEPRKSKDYGEMDPTEVPVEAEKGASTELDDDEQSGSDATEPSSKVPSATFEDDVGLPYAELTDETLKRLKSSTKDADIGRKLDDMMGHYRTDKKTKKGKKDRMKPQYKWPEISEVLEGANIPFPSQGDMTMLEGNDAARWDPDGTVIEYYSPVMRSFIPVNMRGRYRGAWSQDKCMQGLDISEIKPKPDACEGFIDLGRQERIQIKYEAMKKVSLNHAHLEYLMQMEMYQMDILPIPIFYDVLHLGMETMHQSLKVLRSEVGYPPEDKIVKTTEARARAVRKNLQDYSNLGLEPLNSTRTSLCQMDQFLDMTRDEIVASLLAKRLERDESRMKKKAEKEEQESKDAEEQRLKNLEVTEATKNPEGEEASNKPDQEQQDKPLSSSMGKTDGENVNLPETAPQPKKDRHEPGDRPAAGSDGVRRLSIYSDKHRLSLNPPLSRDVQPLLQEKPKDKSVPAAVSPPAQQITAKEPPPQNIPDSKPKPNVDEPVTGSVGIKRFSIDKGEDKKRLSDSYKRENINPSASPDSTNPLPQDNKERLLKVEEGPPAGAAGIRRVSFGIQEKLIPGNKGEKVGTSDVAPTTASAYVFQARRMKTSKDKMPKEQDAAAEIAAVAASRDGRQYIDAARRRVRTNAKPEEPTAGRTGVRRLSMDDKEKRSGDKPTKPP